MKYSQPSNIRKPLSPLGLKGQVKSYQNPERSVTVAGWQGGPLNRSCDLLTKHRLLWQYTSSKREVALPGLLLMSNWPKPTRNQKANAQLIQSTEVTSQSTEQGGGKIRWGKSRI